MALKKQSRSLEVNAVRIMNIKRCAAGALALTMLGVSIPMILNADPGDKDDPVLEGTSIKAQKASADDKKGLVIGAPHDGFDSHSGKIAEAIGGSLKCGWVVAHGFRKKSKKRYVNVNRPSEKPYKNGIWGREQETARAKRVCERYIKAIKTASGQDKSCKLIVEIHGNSRYVGIKGRRVALDVIECATRGFKEDELKKLLAVYKKSCKDHNATDLPALYIEGIKEHESYVFKGLTKRFYFRASGAKYQGALTKKQTKRMLHFELPRSVRFEKDKRKAMIKVLEDVVKAAWKVS